MDLHDIETQVYSLSGLLCSQDSYSRQKSEQAQFKSKAGLAKFIIIIYSYNIYTKVYRFVIPCKGLRATGSLSDS